MLLRQRAPPATRARRPARRRSRCRPRWPSSARSSGRAETLARLERRYELAEAGERQFVLLCGEAGIGKTTLAGELARRVTGDATVLYGRSDAESLVPYQPFIEAVQHFMSHREGVVLPAEIEPELGELARFVPALRRRLGAVREPLAEDPETRRYRLFEAVTRVIAFVARRRPVVLVLDDLHWADTSTSCCSATCCATRSRCGCW